MREEIIIKLEKDIWKSLLDKSIEKKRKIAKVDGFRTGKVTKEVYLKHYGMADAISDAANDAINEKLVKIYEEKKIMPIMEPSVEPIKISEDEFEVKVIIIKEPKVTLGKYTNLGIKKEEVKVTKKEVTEAINELRDKYAELEVKDGKVEKGDVAIIDYEGFKDGIAFAGGKADNYELTIGSNTFIPGFEDAIIGMAKEEEKDIDLTFPKDYHSEELKGQKVVFKVKVNEIKTRVLPKLDNDFFADLGMDNVSSKEELEKEMEHDLKHKKEHEVEHKYEDDVFEKVIADAKFEIDEILIHDEAHHIYEEYVGQMSMYGMNEEMIMQYSGKSKEDLIHEMEKEADKRIKARYIIKEIAALEKVKVTDKEVEEEISKLADNYNTTNDDIIKQVGSKEYIKYNVMVNKTIDIMKANK